MNITKVLLLRIALKTFSAQSVFVLGIALNQMQNHAFDLVEGHEVHKEPTS